MHEKGQDILITDSDHSYVSATGYRRYGGFPHSVKKLVYEDKKLTMDELMKALDNNFAGDKGEEIRQCAGGTKFGNDIDEADMMVREVGKFPEALSCHIKTFDVPCKISREGCPALFRRTGNRPLPTDANPKSR